MFPEDPPETYEDYFDDCMCEGYIATPDNIEQYRNEKDPEARIQFAYAYCIDQKDLYPEDYKAIIDDVCEAMRQAEQDNASGEYSGIRDMGDL